MNQEDLSRETNRNRPHRYRRRDRHGFFGGIVLGAIVGALLAVSIGAYAQSGFRDGMRWGDHDPQHAAEHIDFVLDVVLNRIDATGEQRLEVNTIVQGLVADLQTVVDERDSAQDAIREILSQPSVDRAALEQLRANGILQADAASQRFVQALGDVAEVLTPEQRIELMELRHFHRH
jgi:Spy/CpxP family protein refolding chaperone